jgi:hypothetical protein
MRHGSRSYCLMTMNTTWFGVLLALGGSLQLLADGPQALAQNAAHEVSQQSMTRKTLAQVVAERPFPEYNKWWALGNQFSTFMAESIVAEWSSLPGHDGDLGNVSTHVSEYLRTVYRRDARSSLTQDFARHILSQPLQSGEFDALSYAFFRSAFDLIERHIDRYEQPLQAERRQFTKRVGRRFFTRLHDHLGLNLPKALNDEASLRRLKASVRQVSAFLEDQGYFRDHAAFRFDVDVRQKVGRIVQPEAAFLERLTRERLAHAVFEMGYPVILPSAVYLFQTVGEAQHHSSRTIEELFDRVGCEASETADFDPSGYPPDMVVELWEIRRR